jgi:hypothetical protein
MNRRALENIVFRVINLLPIFKGSQNNKTSVTSIELEYILMHKFNNDYKITGSF